jgi:DNA-binding response OmpR family regulator
MRNRICAEHPWARRDGLGESAIVSRVLVIDDEPRIVSFVRRALEADGLSAHGVTDGARGLTLAVSGRFDLVLLDLLMPGMDGTSVLAQTIEHRPDQAVIVLSALDDVDTKVRCLSLGATDYVSKPFALAELLARVRARLRVKGSVRGDKVLRAGGVALDLRRRTADAGGGPVGVSGREFLLLQHLMNRAGEVCSRAEILEDVWGVGFDPGTNVVEVYIRRLRSKLGPYTIETVRHVGYCLHQ